MKVSVILPAYNEAGNIVELVQQIITNIPENWEYEIIVVDDNSPDQTHQITRSAFKDNPAVIPVLRTTDRGLAKSIRAAIEKARGDQILIMDTDFTHDPSEIPKLLHVGKMYDIVSGSRFCSGGNMQDKRHYIASLIYNWIIRIVLRTQVQDNLGGFFTMSKNRMKLLPFDFIFFGYGDYFFRLLHYAQKLGMTIVEVPAQYRSRHTDASKSNFLKLLFAYTAAVLKLKWQGTDMETESRMNQKDSWL